MGLAEDQAGIEDEARWPRGEEAQARAWRPKRPVQEVEVMLSAPESHKGSKLGSDMVGEQGALEMLCAGDLSAKVLKSLRAGVEGVCLQILV